MTEEQWKRESERCIAVIGELCQSVIDDTFDLVRVVDVQGNQLTGVQVNGRVLMLVVPTDKQVPIRNGGETLQ